MRETVKRFNPVEHRLELVSEIKGVKFYNDSKATSVDATLKALEAFQDDAGKVVLILGGRGKQAPYAPLETLVRHQVRRLILIGEDAETIAKELGGFAPNERAANMQEAVQLSFQSAHPEISCCWRQPVPVSICLKVSNIGEESLKTKSNV